MESKFKKDLRLTKDELFFLLGLLKSNQASDYRRKFYYSQILFLQVSKKVEHALIKFENETSE